MQVYLPDELYALVKDRGLPASELLQDAVRAEVRRLDLLAESDAYVDEMIDQIGEPSPRQLARARAIARAISARGRRQAS